MKLIPKIGLPNLPFGSPAALILKVLGKPKQDNAIGDEPTNPKGRRWFVYPKLDLVVIPDRGLISVTLDSSECEICLWDTVVNSYGTAEFSRLLIENGCNPTTSDVNQYDEQFVESPGDGIIAEFTEDELMWLELLDPDWRSPPTK
jgi:hypothetical protein